MRFALDSEDLGRLFPSHILVDKHLNIIDFGASIGKRLPDLTKGDHLEDHFIVSNPEVLNALPVISANMPSIQLRSRSRPITMTGVIIESDGTYLLALNPSPIPDPTELTGLRMSDLSPTDPSLDNILLIKMQDAMIAEAKEMAAKLTAERQKSDALLQQVSRISGCLAHDFNNHLSIIKLNAQRLAQEASNNRQIAAIAEILMETTTRSSAIASSLVTLSSSQNDKRREFVADEILQDSLPYLKSLTSDGIDLILDLGASGVKVKLGQAGFLNCLTNLILNSCDAILGEGRIEISTYQSVNWLVVEVSDNGMGLGEAAMAQAFEPYFSTKEKGTGLGLASVQDFMTNHGGTVELLPNPVPGALARLKFPIIQDLESVADMAPLAQTGLPIGPSDQPRILVVDDEQYALEALVELLEQEGYHVAGASSPREGIGLVQEYNEADCPFDALLTDVIMPKGNGIILAHAARAMSPDIKVIVLSGMRPEEAMPDWPFLQKPLRLELVTETLRKVLGPR